jgi:hypothetical protein
MLPFMVLELNLLLISSFAFIRVSNFETDDLC